MKTPIEIQDWLRRKIAAAIGSTTDEIPLDVPFTNFGLDSILIVTLVDDLEHWLEVPLDPTIFWEYPTISVLTEWLISEKLTK